MFKLFFYNPLEENNKHWEFTVEQILNPETHRPERQVIKGLVKEEKRSISPVSGSKVSEDELEVQSKDHTVMTSTSLLPKDGKMSLFGGGAGAIGLLFDIRLCDLVGENFVFDQDAITSSDWWQFANAEDYRKKFPAYTVNDLREKTGLIEFSENCRDYNELLTGLNLQAMAGIVLQPAVENPLEEIPIKDKLLAIYRKIYMYDMTRGERHLPIIILDAHKGPYEYTLDQQKKDLAAYKAQLKRPDFFANWLEIKMTEMEIRPVEVEKPCKKNNNIEYANVAKQINESEEIIRKVVTQNELLKQIMTLTMHSERAELLQENSKMELDVKKDYFQQCYAQLDKEIHAYPESVCSLSHNHYEVDRGMEWRTTGTLSNTVGSMYIHFPDKHEEINSLLELYYKKYPDDIQLPQVIEQQRAMLTAKYAEERLPEEKARELVQFIQNELENQKQPSKETKPASKMFNFFSQSETHDKRYATRILNRIEEAKESKPDGDNTSSIWQKCLNDVNDIASRAQVRKNSNQIYSLICTAVENLFPEIATEFNPK